MSSSPPTNTALAAAVPEAPLPPAAPRRLTDHIPRVRTLTEEQEHDRTDLGRSQTLVLGFTEEDFRQRLELMAWIRRTMARPNRSRATRREMLLKFKEELMREKDYRLWLKKEVKQLRAGIATNSRFSITPVGSAKQGLAATTRNKMTKTRGVCSCIGLESANALHSACKTGRYLAHQLDRLAASRCVSGKRDFWRGTFLICDIPNHQLYTARC